MLASPASSARRPTGTARRLSRGPKSSFATNNWEGHHLAHEIQLLAMVFDRGIREAPREWLNLESTEFLARRLYGMERAFSEVRKESDWKPPKDKQKGFKSKVQWHFLEECDPRMLEASDLHVASVDKEIRERLTERGKLLKSLSSLESGDKDKDQ